jgi:hypothetical protein
MSDRDHKDNAVTAVGNGACVVRAFHYSSGPEAASGVAVLSSLEFLRRPATSHEFVIQVGTPSIGSTHFIATT